MKKYVYIISCFLLSAFSAFAEDIKIINTLQDMETVILPVDTAALNIASEKISDTDIAKNAFLAALASKNQMVIGELYKICDGELGINFVECGSFITEYVNILTNRTNCTKANKMEFIYNWWDLDKCYGIVDKNIKQAALNNKGRGSADEFTYEQCKQAVEAAEKCQIYLTYYYKDKLLDPDITKKEQKKYKCMLEKLETGNIEFPTTKMEESCKS